MTLKKLCPKCNKIIDNVTRYCDECQGKLNERHQQYDSTVRYTRDKQFSEFYKSKEWIRVRKAALIRDNGLCQSCIKNGKIKAADMVHHKIEIKTDWSKRIDINNLISLCNQCHSQIDHTGGSKKV